MFSVEIEKFRRMMDIRRARYKHDLEVKFPFLDIKYGDAPSFDLNDNKEAALVLQVKEDFLNNPPVQWAVAKELKLVLYSDILNSTESYITSIYMFDDENTKDDVRKRVMNNVDMLWSLLFKTTTPDDLSDSDLFEKCLKEIDRRTANGPISMYNIYKRVSNRSRKEDFTSAIIKLDLEIAGEATYSLISTLKRDHENIAKILIEYSKKDMEIYF